MMNKILTFKFLSSKIGGWWFWILGVMLFINFFILMPLSFFTGNMDFFGMGMIVVIVWIVPSLPFVFLGFLGLLVKEFRELRGK